MDILTVLPPPIVSLPPAVNPPPPALQVQISCCLLHVNRVRYKPFDWLNFHLSTKGKNAFMLMINDYRGDNPTTYTGFISMGVLFSPFFNVH